MSEIPSGVLFGMLCVLIVLSAFFSGSETALMTLNRYRLRHLKEQGHPGAARAFRLLERPDRLIGLILLGNNFVNILATSVATVLALRLGGEAGLALMPFILTPLILIFAEVTPKTLAALDPEKLAFPSAFVYAPLLVVTYPFVWVVNLIANGLLRALGLSTDDSANQTLSQEELRTVVAEAGAMMPKRYHEMLLSVLDLGAATVDEIMIPRQEVEAIDLDAPMEEIIRELQTSHYTRIPIYQQNIDNIVGIVHIRKAMHALLDGKFTKERLMEVAEPPYFIPKSTALNRQLIHFQRERRHLGLVVDEYGDFMGLMTLADVLEEIVGEFTTDPQDSIPDVHPQADGSWLVAGQANVRELVRAFHWALPTDGPRTLNGLIVEYMETIPEPGTSLLLNGYPVEILQTQDNTVKMAKIWPSIPKAKRGSAR